MTAVDPLSVNCDEQTCRAPAGAGCIGRECLRDGSRATFPCAPHATRIGKARAVAEAREQASVNPLLTSCPRDNCEEAGHACIEWEVVEVGADGRATHSTAREVEPHPERVEKAERLAREIDAGSERRAEDADQRGTESALAVRIGGLRPHVETRDAIRFPAPSSISRMDAMRAELPDTFEDWTNEHRLMAYDIQWLRDHLGRRNRQRDARRIRMAAKRRRGWR